MENKEHSYLQFPLCLLQKTFDDPTEGINLMIDFGIVNYAKKIKYHIQDVARQVLYSWYRQPDVLQRSIRTTIKAAIAQQIFIPDDDYNGFTGKGEFNPDNISEITELFNDDEQFKEACILHYQIHIATSADQLDIKIGSDDTVIPGYKEALLLKQKFESQFGSDAMPMCPAQILFDFRDKDKNIELFRSVISIRSLIGLKNYIATTRFVILMRMCGCKSKKALDMFLKSDQSAYDMYQRYARSEKSLRYHFDKLFDQLLARGFIKSKIFMRKVSRKIFISIKLDYNQLAEEIIKYATNRKHKSRENEAVNRIRATI